MRLVLQKVGLEGDLEIIAKDFEEYPGSELTTQTLRTIKFAPFYDLQTGFKLSPPKNNNYPIFIQIHDLDSNSDRWEYSGYVGKKDTVEKLAHQVGLDLLNQLKSEYPDASIKDKVKTLKQELKAVQPKSDQSRQPWIRPSANLSK